MSVIVGAYAASPAHRTWQPQLEAEYLNGLAALEQVRGLELPWLGGLHPHDDAWLLANLPRRFDVVLTGIPGTVGRLAADPHYGLASRDPEGRAAALEESRAMSAAVRRLNDTLGRRAVIGVELHSAPHRRDGSAEQLAASLEELGALDWDGAELLIEHCDAEIAGQVAEKGYLTLHDELSAIAAVPDAGMSLNWGRCAIELRGAEGVTEQIVVAAESGRLRALVFSGASAEAGPFGPAWTDAHHPMAPCDAFPMGEPTSLLTEERLVAALAAAGDLNWVGVKFGFVDAEAPVSERVAMVAAAAALVDHHAAALSSRWPA